MIRASSSISPAIPIRWSTKYTDLETDLVYYGHRYYNPSTGRWLSRDLMEEAGGLNLYAYVGNDPISFHDPFGLAKDCDEICANARSEAKRGGFDPGGTVVCYQGVKCPCVIGQPDWGLDYGKCPEFDTMVMMHEMEHVGETKDCDSCREDIYAAPWDDGVDPKASECSKRKRDVGEMDRMIGNKIGSASCRRNIKRLRDMVNQWVKDNCK